MSYNGWSNHQTWAFKLHIDNNEGDYLMWNDKVSSIKKNSKTPLIDVVDELKDWWDEIFEAVIDGESTDEGKMMVRDIGNGNEINFYEVAEALIEETEN